MRDLHHISWVDQPTYSGALIRITDPRTKELHQRFIGSFRRGGKKRTLELAVRYRDRVGPLIQGNQWPIIKGSRGEVPPAVPYAYKNSLSGVPGVCYMRFHKLRPPQVDGTRSVYEHAMWVGNWREGPKEHRCTRKRGFIVTEDRTYEEAFRLAYKARYMALEAANALPAEMTVDPPPCPPEWWMREALEEKRRKKAMRAKEKTGAPKEKTDTPKEQRAPQAARPSKQTSKPRVEFASRKKRLRLMS